MKQTSITLQLEHACVIFTNETSKATGKAMPKLYVQAIDQYAFQREWTLEFRHTPGNSSKLYWESHIYQHPGRRSIVTLGKDQAEACIAEFLRLAQEYPALLFNREGDHASNASRPRHEGFVRFAETLHRGALPSKTML